MLDQIRGPADLAGLSSGEVSALADEIRRFLIDRVAATGGHLGPNLGMVELTLALHRVFESPRDAIIFDTGHQAYVHKILTGRAAAFDTLRTKDGLSGYPSREESEHDWVESSHASTALSYADGLVKASRLTGRRDRRVVAVVGDGALTGGMSWEALNNIAVGRRPVIVVVNDNGRSYGPTVGGMMQRATEPRASLPEPGGHIFTDLGLDYIGPVDGHDEPAIEEALVRAARVAGPVVVHVLTRKGMGYPPAEADDAEQMHSCGIIDPATGSAARVAAPALTWTAVFGDALVRHASRRSDIVAVTAAMPGPTGLLEFGRRFPDRLFDVGIAEQHAVTSAAGLAMGGLHPVVAVYSTFLNRGFDQMLMDVALHRLPVTFVLDRAGVTGPDGASHHGMWDLSVLGVVPGMRVAAPRDAARLREELAEALRTDDGPTAIRFPRGPVNGDIPAVARCRGIDVLRRSTPGAASDVLLVSIGALAGTALEVADRLHHQGIGVTVVDPRWALPVGPALCEFAAEHRVVVTMEDNGTHGGVGSAISTALRAAEIDVVCRDIALPQRFLAHGSRDEILAEAGLTARSIARRVTGWVARGGPMTGRSAGGGEDAERAGPRHVEVIGRRTD